MKSTDWVYVVFLFVLLSACQAIQQNPDPVPPDENRFTTSVLSLPGTLDEPMAFTFLNEWELLVAERKGGLKAFNVESRQMRQVAHVPVNTKYVNKEGRSREAEEGLVGIVAHPGYETNHWIFLLYADPDEPRHVLARFEYYRDSLYESTKKIVLEYPVQRQECCHTGGGMVFDGDGNLYITTGNNTVNPPQGTSNLDERPGHENSDDQRTGGNTNDLRGKILRLHPEDDGTYTIPEGNLFPADLEGARPEIYTMGHRNPWRVSVDSKTGYIYWGEVGPDAAEDTDAGPRGYDEFNQAKGPGFFGWPYFIADNKPYVDSLGRTFNAQEPVNHSPNNTGLEELPPALGAFIWYPYGYSEEFPLLGSAGRSATGGPVFRLADFPESDRRFPAYYEGKWLLVDFMRGNIMSVSIDEKGDYEGMEPFLPQENFSSAIDMQFGPAGDLYVLEYGSAWFRGNQNAQIKRIRYNGGNRPPVVKAGADRLAGALPLKIRLSAEGTMDYDLDPLTYRWTITSDGTDPQVYSEPNPVVNLETAGIYMAQLSVSDSEGNSEEQTLEIVAGNEPPQVDVRITEGNQSFFFPGHPLKYEILVEDREDGSASNGDISAEAIAVNFDYVPDGFDPVEIAQNHRSSDEWVVFSRGRSLIDQSDCFSCHRIDVKSIGPSYRQVAQRYRNDPQTRAMLAGRIINGSVGLWGEHAMSAHPALSKQDAGSMVEYIMGLNTPQQAPESIPLSGSYIPLVPENESGKGGYLLRAAYRDESPENLRPITSEKIIALRNPVLLPETADESRGLQVLITPRRQVNVLQDEAYVLYRDLDLGGIAEVVIRAEASARNGAAGGTVELRVGSVTGELAGVTEKVTPVDIDFRAELRKRREAWEKEGKKGPEPNLRSVRELLQPRYSIPLGGRTGRHDLYFIIRNPDSKPGQILIQIDNLEFKQVDFPT